MNNILFPSRFSYNSWILNHIFNMNNILFPSRFSYNSWILLRWWIKKSRRRLGPAWDTLSWFTVWRNCWRRAILVHLRWTRLRCSELTTKPKRMKTVAEVRKNGKMAIMLAQHLCFLFSKFKLSQHFDMYILNRFISKYIDTLNNMNISKAATFH